MVGALAWGGVGEGTGGGAGGGGTRDAPPQLTRSATTRASRASCSLLRFSVRFSGALVLAPPSGTTRMMTRAAERERLLRLREHARGGRPLVALAILVHEPRVALLGPIRVEQARPRSSDWSRSTKSNAIRFFARLSSSSVGGLAMTSARTPSVTFSTVSGETPGRTMISIVNWLERDDDSCAAATDCARDLSYTSDL